MRLVAKKPATLVLEEGAVLDGYTVERVTERHGGPELRYFVTARDGERATLHVSRLPFADRDERARFKRLAELRVAFEHPAAIEVSAFGEHIGHPYLVTEPYDSARTFGHLLEEESPLDPDRMVELLEPVVAALDLAHSQGLVHQSLGAGSLLLAGDGRLLLDSFALFELGGESPWTTVQRADLRYRAPEQIRADPLGPSANVYSLGALIVHALTGEPPYSGDRLALEYAHGTQPAPSVSERVRRLNPAIDAVIQRALAKYPAGRPSSATQLLAQVADALGVETSLPAPEPLAPLPVKPDPSTEPLPTTGLAPAGVLASAADAPPKTSRRRGRRAARADAPPKTSRRRGRRAARVDAPPKTSRRRGRRAARVAAPLAEASPQTTRRFGRAAIAVAAVLAAVSGGALALALDPFGGDAPRAATPSAAAVWSRLDTQQSALRTELAAAKTPQEQTAIAGRLADAYDAAAREAGPGEQARAARAVADAYSALAAAAGAGQEPQYAQASEDIARAEQQLQARR